MKKKIVCVLLLLTLVAGMFAACKPEDKFNREDRVKVTFELEGGVYKNSTYPIVHYYKFEDNQTSRLIVDPSTIEGANSDKKITNGSKKLSGWYKTKTEVDGEVTYSDPWDFATDVVSAEGVTLYAYWRLPVEHRYDVYAVGEDGTVAETAYNKFIDVTGINFGHYVDNGFVKAPSGKTIIAGPFADDACTTALDLTKKHDGAPDQDKIVNVYYKVIDGVYSIVNTAEELQKALMSGQNVYLNANVDMSNVQMAPLARYNRHLRGNGHTISNLTVVFQSAKANLETIDGESGSVAISLFGATRNAKVDNVVFSNVTFRVDTDFNEIKRFVIAPLSVNATALSVTNVTFSGKVEVARQPQGATFVYAPANQMWFVDVDDQKPSVADGTNSVTLTPAN